MCYSLLVVQDLKYLEKRFGAAPVRQDFEAFEKLSASNPKKFKEMVAHERIYPNYFAPIIVGGDGKRLIRPMRYRIRPAGTSEEIPSKYNVFNARLDALDTRRTWKSLFMKNHGIVPFRSFFEWVKDKETGKNRVLRFFPEGTEVMWSPVLYDRWDSPDGTGSFYSFAVLTTDPPPEIAAQGHDRCPIFLKEDAIDAWLAPSQTKKNKIMEILQSPERVTYLFDLAA